MITTTSEQIIGKHTHDTIGIVTATDYLHLGSSIENTQNHLSSTLHGIIKSLEHEAEILGANAVVAVKVQVLSVDSSTLVIIAFGTAILLD